MSTRVTVSETALRELVREALNNQKFGSVIVEDNDAVVNVSNVVDASAAVTDPGDPNYVPNNRVELQVAIKALSDDLPDEKVSDVYQKLVGALNVSKEKNEVESEDKMKKEETKVESVVRAAIRKHLQEQETVTQAFTPPRKFSKKPKNFGPVVGPMPPVQKIPTGVHGGEYNRRADKQKADLQKVLKKTNIEDDFGGGKSDDEALPTGAKNTMMTDVSGASFQDIANELGFSVAGAKQAVDKALLKAQWAASMQMENPEDLEIIVLTSMNDYIKMLSKTGELSSADVQLMKDHPDIVRELDGFREFLDRAVRKARKPEGLENPLGESKKKKKKFLRENSDRLVSLEELNAALSEWERTKSEEDNDVNYFLEEYFGDRDFSSDAIEYLYEQFPEEMAKEEFIEKPNWLPNAFEKPVKKNTLKQNAKESLVSLEEIKNAVEEWRHFKSEEDNDINYFISEEFGERELSNDAIEYLYEQFPEEMAKEEFIEKPDWLPNAFIKPIKYNVDTSQDVIDCPICHGNNTHYNTSSKEIECRDCDDSFPVVEHVSKVKKESRTIRKGNLKIVLEKAGDGVSKKCKFCNQDVKVATTTAGEYFDEHKKSDGSDCHGSKSRTAAAAVSEGKRVNEIFGWGEKKKGKTAQFTISIRYPKLAKISWDTGRPMEKWEYLFEDKMDEIGTNIWGIADSKGRLNKPWWKLTVNKYDSRPTLVFTFTGPEDSKKQGPVSEYIDHKDYFKNITFKDCKQDEYEVTSSEVRVF